MKQTGRIIGVAILLSLAATLWFVERPLEQAPAPVTDFRRGVGLGLFASDPDYDYEHLLQELHARGASDVLLVVPLYQRDVQASSQYLLDGHSPSMQTVDRTIGQASELGLRVGLMPIVRLEERSANEWRGVIQPESRNEWFASYESHLAEFTELASAHDIEMLVIGSELNSLEWELPRWRALIEDTRQRFDGDLVYSANWDHYERVPFWRDLDAIGISAYFPVSENAEVNADEIEEAWSTHLVELEAFAEFHDRPLILTEIGYPSISTAGSHPWDHTRSNELRPDLQAELWTAFCSASAESGAIDGFFAWNWFGHGGPRDPSFSLRGKPAASVLATCFADTTWDTARAPAID